MAPSKPEREWKPVKVLPEVGALCLEGLIDSSDEKDVSQAHTQRDTHMHTPKFEPSTEISLCCFFQC